MNKHDPRGVLLDIEGTTSPVSYVYDVLFPFARANAEFHLRQTWATPATDKAVQLMARDAGFSCAEEWFDSIADKEAVAVVMTEVIRLMDGDIKATGLKELQGLIWAEGYANGALRSEVFDDVPVALQRWIEAAVDVRIYSSGSIGAQKVFFKNTRHGDLTRYLSGYYDTTTGPKRQPHSYELIAEDFELPPAHIIFFSDVVEELDAAAQAGMRTILVVRKGNAVLQCDTHSLIHSFQELESQCVTG